MLSDTLHPRIKAILEKEERSSDWVNSLDNGSGCLYKFDEYTDGTYIECIRSINWGDATGEQDGMYMIEQGNLIMPPHSQIEDELENLNNIGDIVHMIMGYSGVESHYGGGDEVWVESEMEDKIEEEDIDHYTIVPKDTTIDNYIVDTYT